MESQPQNPEFLKTFTHAYGFLGQGWYLIELIPDLCLLPYFIFIQNIQKIHQENSGGGGGVLTTLILVIYVFQRVV